MMSCPTCKEVYPAGINFCLADGTTLLKQKKTSSDTRSVWNDVLAIAVAVAAILIFICLITSTPGDRSWISTGNGSAGVRNWIGSVGANVAAILVSALGWTAHLVPLLIFLSAVRIYQKNRLVPPVGSVIGYVFFAVAMSGLISLLGGQGAIVGEAAAYSIAYFLGLIGAGIVLAAIFVSSVFLITDFTLGSVLGGLSFAGTNFKLRLDAWRARPPEEIAAARKRAEKRKAKREYVDVADVPPTISIGDTEIKTAARGVGRALPLFDEPPDSVATLDAANPFETKKVLPGNSQTAASEKARKTSKAKPVDLTTIEATERTEKSRQSPAPDFDKYKLPDSKLLTEAPAPLQHQEAELRSVATLLASKTAEFNVPGKVMHIAPGPVVTTFEFKPDAGVKYSRVTGLVDDLCLALKAPSIRIDRIPGKAYVGIEVPNQKREIIHLREVIESDKFTNSQGKLTLGLGKTIDGAKYVADLAKMPHLLIAGATGAGKSVGVNTLVMSILYKARPDEVKFIMVDPKRLELGLYEDIPHLSVPIITDPKKAATALRWAVGEMEKRYKDLAGYGVRNIDGYNVEAKRRNDNEQWDEMGEPHRKLPYIVIIIDELADLMMVSGKEVEESITRLAQMARAVGIHLVLATQRPSVDVITGLIKANFPARISFRVSSKVDSRTIIDANGAESLLGQGDMLFLPPGNSQVTRVHGAFVDEAEIKKVVDFIKAQGKPEYDQSIITSDEESDDPDELPGRRDPLFFDALRSVVQAKRGSTSLLQRNLRIGYGRAAAILDAMVREGYIGEMDGSTRARPVLPKAYEDLQDLSEMG